MQSIAKSLTDIVGVWKDITQGLNDVKAWNTLLIIPALLPTVTPELTTRWTGIKDAAEKYMRIITGA
jgi:hypothetical protein